MQSDTPILFYDGECAMCNWFVRFIISIDKTGKIHFAALDSLTASKIPEVQKVDEDTVVLFFRNEIFIESNAVLEVFRILGGFWNVFLCFRIIPPFFRNKIYRMIAVNRMKLFGKAKSCPLPPINIRRRFLN